MSNRDDDNEQAFNVALARFFGFYQMLDPKTEKRPGYRHVYRRALMCFVAYECFVSALTFLNGLYYCTNNATKSMWYFGAAANILYTTYKMWYLVVYHSKDLWDCLSVARFDFTTFRQDGRDGTLDSWRNRSVGFTNAIAVVYFWCMVAYLAYPLMVGDTLIAMTNHDGSSGHYRLNIFSLYSFVPAGAYNAHFNVFYAVEAVSCVIAVLFMVTSDILLISLSLAITCQLKMISTALISAGHESRPRSQNLDSNNDKIKICNEHNLDVFNNLKTIIIIDHQRVLKKYDVFLKIFRWIMLSDVLIMSSTIILLCFIILASLIQGKFAEMTLMQSILIALFIGQLYMKCSLFENLHNERDSIIFALYSSNWTEMNMKCKKLILLTMKLNSGDQQKLKFTSTRVVNLEMFYNTIRICYTIISALVNSIKKQ